MTYLERVLADALNPEKWQAARLWRIGASDAATYAKRASVPLYVRAKLRAGGFRGNAHTATGNRWEEPALAAAGWKRNTLLIRHTDVDGFVATPDGISPDGRSLAEAKAKLVDEDTFDPDTWMPTIPPTHRRQIAWAQYVLGAEWTDYIVLPYSSGYTPLLMTPRVIRVERDDSLIASLVAIATPVLVALNAARQFERNLS